MIEKIKQSGTMVKDKTWERMFHMAMKRLGFTTLDLIKKANKKKVIKLQKKLYGCLFTERYYDFHDDIDKFYEAYMSSSRWRQLRFLILNRDNYICRDCGKFADHVHHNSYEHFNTKHESIDCISLCQNCHFNRHKDNLYDGGYSQHWFTHIFNLGIKENYYYTVMYCPKCKCQRTWHTKNNQSNRLFYCDICRIQFKYNPTHDKFEIQQVF